MLQAFCRSARSSIRAVSAKKSRAWKSGSACAAVSFAWALVMNCWLYFPFSSLSCGRSFWADVMIWSAAV